MKRLIPIFILLMIGLKPITSSSQCTFVSPTVDIVSTQTQGANCTIVFNLSFDVLTNSGNKYIFVHLWEDASYPALPYSNPPTAAELSNTVLNLVIDNFGAVSLECTYTAAPTVTIQCPTNNPTMSLTKIVGGGANGADRFIVNNVSITRPGACSNSFTFKGDAWGTNANSAGPPVQCSMLGFAIGVNDPLVSGFCVGAFPNASYNFNIATSSAALSVYYDVYLDNGDDVLVPSAETLIASVDVNSAIPITPTTPFNSGTVNYPPAYNTLAFAGRKIFVVVFTVTKTFVLSATITPCAVTEYDFGDLPTTGTPSWPAARAVVIDSYDTANLKLDNAVAANTNAIWAGTSVGITVDATTPYSACTLANCDPFDNGLGSPVSVAGSVTSVFTVTTNGNLAGLTAYYGLWFDWNNDGNFANDLNGDGGPAFYSGSNSILGPSLINVNVKPPLGLSSTYKVRLIVSGAPVTNLMFNSTSIVNGEVEDYNTPAPVIPPVNLKLKVLLQGAVVGNVAPNLSIMRDNLRNSPFTATNYIPNGDPYTIDPEYSGLFTKVGDGLNLAYQTVLSPATMFADRTGTNTSAIDWIFIELRDKNNPATVLATRSAIVQQDGSVVDIDGTDCVKFPTQISDDYYVAVRHRNHLGAMTATALSAATFNCVTTVDFTTMTDAQLWNSAPAYDGLEQAILDDGKRALWAGNANGDDRVKYQGSGVDRTLIQSDVVNHINNVTLNINFDLAYGYLKGDINMDSKSKYQGSGNERTILQSLVLGYLLNTTQSINFDLFLQQLP